MLTPNQQEELRVQAAADEAEMREFVASHKGKISIDEPYITVKFGKDQAPELAGKHFKASSWHNLRAIIKDEGVVQFG
jgi:hypothetical protein